MTFREVAMQSAKLYYEFLNQNGGGLVTYRVLRIEKDRTAVRRNQYWLYLDQKPKNPDSLMFRIGNLSYTNTQIRPDRFDAHNRALKVSLNESVIGVFDGCDLKDVVVYSDLKFLVRRVESWYDRFGDRLSLPNGRQVAAPADCSALAKYPSEDQLRAIEGVLSNPFTYVWGAPGTGKTQFVLARAVLAYMQAGKRVLVTAPTNNAVEQTLYGILPVLEEAGLDYDELVVRLGTASSEFQAKYPGVCEDSAFSKALTELNDHLSSLHLSLKEAKQLQKLFQDYLHFQKKQQAFQDAMQKTEAILPQLNRVGVQLDSLRSVIEKDRLKILRLQAELEENENNRIFYNRQAQELLKRLRNPFFGLFSRQSKDEAKKQIEELLKNVRIYEEKEEGIRSTLSLLQEQSDNQENDLTTFRAQFQKSLSELMDCLHFSEELFKTARAIQENNYPTQIQKLEQACAAETEALETERARYLLVETRTEESFEKEKSDIMARIIESEQRKHGLEQMESSKRVENCRIVACTIDVCLSRLSEEFFDHAFLDEAGYSSLIKGATLTAFANRLTFLGDHMQLPPVCEADDLKIKTEKLQPIALWAQSALFVETIFSRTPEQIYIDYLSKAHIPFRSMVKYTLINSYRFGEALARVLANDVYDRSFRGNSERPTRVFYIDAPKIAGQKKRTSQTECDAIGGMLRNYSGFHKSTGIIAPYRNQVELLRQMAKQNHFPPNHVVTVHQSQGREWDNVFLSVTDTSDKFFTNSLSPVSDGKKVINTAVSRARNNLILVCDYQYWITQKKQLIGKLLAVAEELNVQK